MENVFLTSLTIPEVRDLFKQELSPILCELQKQSDCDNKLDPWYSLSELCSYLPEKPAKSTVYNWVNSSSIPFYKRGKRLYFLKSEIDRWLSAGLKNNFFEIKEVVNG